LIHLVGEDGLDLGPGYGSSKRISKLLVRTMNRLAGNGKHSIVPAIDTMQPFDASLAHLIRNQIPSYPVLPRTNKAITGTAEQSKRSCGR
jgi:hypothetical protein